ncbi:MAG: dihydrofolate reductase family protein [Nanoarchaeota archaeon]|nr:dihydrofolate reductase family protein [Nanoarchaeota archaeon]
MKRGRTFNTLFMLSSIDGRISTGEGNERDFDKDLRNLKGLKEGLHQYYNLEKRTDFHSLNTGKVMAKIGVNTENCPINCPKVSFIIIDNHHLNETGIINLINRTKKLYLVTSNKNHPAFKLKDKIELIYYEKIDFNNLFSKLRKNYKIDRITVQSGGTLNSILIREGLIDQLSLVIAPALIGGVNTPSLIDGSSLLSKDDLKLIKTLKLVKCNKLDNSYLHLVYDVKN